MDAAVLRAVACLAQDPDIPKSADVLAAETKVPRRYLHKVLQDLSAAELVGSRPGPGGGYMLSADADTVSILDVINAVSPLECIRHCPLGLPSHTTLCPQGTRPSLCCDRSRFRRCHHWPAPEIPPRPGPIVRFRQAARVELAMTTRS